ncbi:MAG: Putative carbohydrate kinase, PfkB family [Leptospirillum sp. Group II 'C75']|nr:MAG: putative carbohydrate kinase, PfkB family [Leptospirillum rubarum]EIJ75769.1 MAG: Putative carbohydrate kinase, PfkB family [Leptospirillum sp. Group II 'C75']
MPNMVIVGTVALDNIRTPFGEVRSALGGSAFYAGLSASYWTEVGVVAIVGEDYPEEGFRLLERHGVDYRGITRSKEKTFSWTGEYTYDLNTAHTLKTELNCLLSFAPDLPAIYDHVDTLFLANIDPEIQLRVLDSMPVRPSLVVCDTMNFWIENKLPDLKKVLSRIDILTINEGEARMLSGEFSLVAASRKITAMGPKTLIVKRGEYGVLVFGKDSVFASPAYPLEEVKDPTGAGDSFAGGVIGYMTRSRKSTNGVLRQGVVVGSAMASFCVEDFSTRGLENLSKTAISGRLSSFASLTSYPDLPPLDAGMKG